jgi:hypothetical protein
MPRDVASDPSSVHESVAEGLQDLKGQVYAHYGQGALTRLSEELGVKYETICILFSDRNAERIRQIEEIVTD